ncbi:Gfo/Idh/MocA family protein [Thioclava nitratireducens]|uniref:Gfo/Idh/MocA family protein n=1 Tax=Thioclava nitratireducens TaxID=1915078 RepID=UPI002481111C|nr:Gfo/Idh/MocA family oxidoreductase [Thioclava nitratireducens]WGT51235.1 Gfo/Idh/MocA family oxidoreductase [Thioclava nitratireducens]
MSLAVGLVGLGAIARAQHLPAIAETDGVHLAAIASRNATLPDLPSYPDLRTMLDAEPEIGAVSLCTPPQGRFDQAMAVLRAGRHLMLEKPPGMTLSEVEALRETAAKAGLTIFATWHSREAAAVEAARQWLAGREISAIHIDWREDVRKWHPGQEWIWQPGGLGVFDPGINALSILTRVLRQPVRLTAAALSIPQGRQTPIAADLEMCAGETPISAAFDWRETGDELWRITLQTDRGAATLDKGGAEFSTDGEVIARGENREYANLYARMRDLVRAGQSDLDLAPMRLVADAFINARFAITEPFDA